MRLKRTAISVEPESRFSFRAGSREQRGRLRGERIGSDQLQLRLTASNRGMQSARWDLEIHLRGKDTWDIDASEHRKHQGGVVEYHRHPRS